MVVDNIDPAPGDRAALITAAVRAGVPVRAVRVVTRLPVCLARNDAREGRVRVPLRGVLATRRRLVPPEPTEGLDRVDVVPGDS